MVKIPRDYPPPLPPGEKVIIEYFQPNPNGETQARAKRWF